MGDMIVSDKVCLSTALTFSLSYHLPLLKKFPEKGFRTMAFLWASQVALVVKNLTANAGDIGDSSSTSVLGRSPGGGHGNPLQYSCLENPMDRGAWWATVCSVRETDMTEAT